MQFQPILTSIALVSALTFSVFDAAQAQSKAADNAQSDALIVEMNQAFAKADRKRLTALLPQVKGHTLEAWGAYWELRARLDTAGPTEIKDFLSRYAGSYQEDRLRNDWLLMMGQRREWAKFSAEHADYRMKDDREVHCYGYAADFLINATDSAAQLKRQWYGAKDADDACTFAAAALYGAKKLSDADIWRKARLAMEANRPRSAKNAVEIVSSGAAKQIDNIQSNANNFLAKKVITFTQTAKESVVLALIRLALSDPEAAASALDKRWGTHLSSEQRSWVWGVIGKQIAQRLTGDANAAFAKANDTELSDEHLGWKVRAALRQMKWRTVLAATQAMSAEARLDATWVYWQARALLQLTPTDADRAEAARLLTSIASVRGFYEQLALEELGQRITTPAKPLALTAEERFAAHNNAGLSRALYAIALGLRSEGVREWNYSTNLHQKGGMGDRDLLAAAELACQREVWDRCINTSERTKTLVDFEQRFPMPHKKAVLQRAAQIGLDPAYVYGLIRQESRFIMDARSGVGASGLMQVMPPTAKWTAQKIGMTDFKPHQINDRDINIAIGTGYLKLVLDDFAGSMPMAAAAYNAGPSRPRNWRGQAGGPVLEAAIWAENVPFQETRDYVKKVLSNTTNYAALMTGQPQSLKSRLGLVGPKDIAVIANTDLP
jgi:soluble lytic murein transglycosylase